MTHFLTNNPLVTIAIPSYNHARYIDECIKSIIKQDYDQIELIVIDDGSSDDSVERIKELIPECEKRFVRFEFRYRENKGLCSTLNEALYWAKGDFFSPTASDDVLMPNKISSQLKAFHNFKDQGVVGVLSGIKVFGDKGSIKSQYDDNRVISFEEVIVRKYRMPGQATMFLTDKLVSIDGYDPKFKVEDFLVFLKITEKGGKLLLMKESLVNYRRHGDNLSAKHDTMWSSISGMLELYKDHPKYQEAVARSMIIQAHSLGTRNFAQSFKWFSRAFTTYPLIIITRGALTLTLKYLLPSFVVKSLKKMV